MFRSGIGARLSFGHTLHRARPFSSRAQSHSWRRTRRRGGVVLFAAIGVLGIASSSTLPTQDLESRVKQLDLSSSPAFDPLRLDSYTEPFRHSLIATSRSSRVVVCALLCFNDYRTAMQSEDPLVMSDCHLKCAKRTLAVLEKNGGIYIKLGQHVSAMSYLLPTEWTTTMTVLQDKCPSSSVAELREMFEADSGLRFDDVFSEMDPEPLGVASLAQVHRARLREDGREVAVKFQHPSLREFVKVDLDTTRFTFSLIKRIFPDFSLTWLSDEMDISLPQELNFAVEARNARDTAAHFSDLRGSSLVVPEMIAADTRYLVMEYIRGARIDDLDYLAKHNMDRNEVSAELARAFNEMIFRAPALHCDPHAGNVFVRPAPRGSRSRHNFEIVLLDHGLYREIPLDLRRSYAKLWLAIIRSDDEGMRKWSYEVAGVGDDRYPLFASAITGRDFTALQRGVSSVPRGDDELKRINTAVGQGLLQQLVHLLADIPRILLLLLKTNDLTRHLDESLHTTSAPQRPFIILAQFCTRVVWDEERSLARQALRQNSPLRALALWLSGATRYYPMAMYLYFGEWWASSALRRTYLAATNSQGEQLPVSPLQQAQADADAKAQSSRKVAGATVAAAA
ncbi:hypothetical protein PYCC9005_001377 [Savitreella phatthalungensis]